MRKRGGINFLRLPFGHDIFKGTKAKETPDDVTYACTATSDESSPQERKFNRRRRVHRRKHGFSMYVGWLTQEKQKKWFGARLSFRRLVDFLHVL
jgi:hypothetical protein